MYLIWCDAQTFIILLYSITDKSWTYTYGNSTIEVGKNTKIVFCLKISKLFILQNVSILKSKAIAIYTVWKLDACKICRLSITLV